jgi:hypothetical protein
MSRARCRRSADLRLALTTLLVDLSHGRPRALDHKLLGTRAVCRTRCDFLDGGSVYIDSPRAALVLMSVPK